MSIKPLFIFINDNLEVNSCTRTGSHAASPGIPCVPSAFPRLPSAQPTFPNSFAVDHQPMRHRFQHVWSNEEKKEKRNTYKNQPRCFHAFLTLSIDFESIFWKHFKEMTENKIVRIMEYAVNVSNRKAGHHYVKYILAFSRMVWTMVTPNNQMGVLICVYDKVICWCFFFSLSSLPFVGASF